VAKKIILGALNEKEVEASHREAELLSRLDHPNIVKYKESFCENNLLIIIMEYCEVGDLSYHVKQKRKRQEFFTETEIMNWFVQLALALQYVHSNKVLHRDIKGSNIYLTSNNTVKIGDFGISRVLEGSVEVANTVIGTPYYMAPEVCQNKPYTFKSDVWSLGCVIYELCTLQHAFNADNLLGLVFKIVSETAEPIPSRYSPQLRQVVQSMLAKDDRARPSISQILASNYVQNQMETFVNTHGQTLVRTLTVRRMLTRDPDKPLPLEETPKERMLRMKREQAEREAEVMRQAARAAYHDKEISRQRKQEMIFSSFHQTPQARAMVHASAQPVNQFSNSGSTIASIAFNDQNSWDNRVRGPSDPTDTYNMSITVSSLSSTDAREKMPLNTDTYDLSMSSPNYPSYYNPYDDIPINSSGQYNLAILVIST
jgi:NIMA (never in mitosis gene a)-related kinase